MTLLHILDGTRDVKWGRAMIPALSQIAAHRQIRCNMEPGCEDLEGYWLVNRVESEAYVPSRNQVSYVHLALGVARAANTLKDFSIILTEQDIFSKNTEWVFGGVRPTKYGGATLTMSVSRIATPELFTHIMTHELGHMFGAAPPTRSNTVEDLGSHCTNLCVMQQKRSVAEMKAQAKRLEPYSMKFCHQCQDDLRGY